MRETRAVRRAANDSRAVLLPVRLVCASWSWVLQIRTPAVWIAQIPGVQPTHLPDFLLDTENQCTSI